MFVSADLGCWAEAFGEGAVPSQTDATTSLSQEGNRVEDFILANDNVGAMLKSFSTQCKEMDPELMRHDFFGAMGTAG